jgi:hypothetical protein
VFLYDSPVSPREYPVLAKTCQCALIQGMKIEEQVCGLDLATKLKDLGVKQESLCYWVEPVHSETKTPFVQVEYPTGYTARPHIAAAFNVAELGELLPATVIGRMPFTNLVGELFRLTISHNVLPDVSRWFVQYRMNIIRNEGTLVEDFGEYFVEESEADARAKMLVYLIEQNLVNLS